MRCLATLQPTICTALLCLLILQATVQSNYCRYYNQLSAMRCLATLQPTIRSALLCLLILQPTANLPTVDITTNYPLSCDTTTDCPLYSTLSFDSTGSIHLTDCRYCNRLSALLCLAILQPTIRSTLLCLLILQPTIRSALSRDKPTIRYALSSDTATDYLHCSTLSVDSTTDNPLCSLSR
jgi:hypothetical protein